MQGILTRRSLSTTQYKILYFAVDKTFRSKCFALYLQLMLRVLLGNAFVHPQLTCLAIEFLVSIIQQLWKLHIKIIFGDANK